MTHTHTHVIINTSSLYISGISGMAEDFADFGEHTANLDGILTSLGTLAWCGHIWCLVNTRHTMSAEDPGAGIGLGTVAQNIPL